MRFVLSLAMGLCGLVGVYACGGKEEPATTAEPTEWVSAGLDPEVVKKAEEIWVTRCVPCHGASGHGDGSASATLDPKPRNLADPEWQKSVTDDFIQKIIKVGGAGVGKSAAMPSNPDLTSSQVVTALKDKVRSFGGK